MTFVARYYTCQCIGANSCDGRRDRNIGGMEKEPLAWILTMAESGWARNFGGQLEIQDRCCSASQPTKSWIEFKQCRHAELAHKRCSVPGYRVGIVTFQLDVGTAPPEVGLLRRCSDRDSIISMLEIYCETLQRCWLVYISQILQGSKSYYDQIYVETLIYQSVVNPNKLSANSTQYNFHLILAAAAWHRWYLHHNYYAYELAAHYQAANGVYNPPARHRDACSDLVMRLAV
jgi:hypothetical protein